MGGRGNGALIEKSVLVSSMPRFLCDFGIWTQGLKHCLVLGAGVFSTCIYMYLWNQAGSGMDYRRSSMIPTSQPHVCSIHIKLCIEADGLLHCLDALKVFLTAGAIDRLELRQQCRQLSVSMKSEAVGS